MNHPVIEELEKMHADWAIERERIKRKAKRQERLLWLLLAIVACAPEIIALGRMALR